MDDRLHIGGWFVAECRDASGALLWREEVHNLVVNQGRTNILEQYFRGSAYTATWYMGLKGAGTIAAADTLASHAGWSEVTPYSGNRPSWGPAAAAANAISNTTPVSYTINATSTVAGIFLASVNTGTSGILFSAVDFSASRSVASGDTITVTYTVNG